MQNDVEIVVKASDRSERGFASVRRNFKQMAARIKKDAESEGGAAGKGLAQRFLAMMSSTWSTSATAVASGMSAQLVSAIAAGLASGAVKLAKGLGAGLALLPAVAAAAGLALGTLKLGLVGVGDALKAGLAGDTDKFNEALEGLAPNARAVARELVGAKDQLDGLKNTVQDNLFGPLIGQVRPLIDSYLPSLDLVLGGIATSLGRAARAGAEWLVLPATVKAVDGALSNMGGAVANLAAGLPALMAALLPLLTVGSSFLPGLSDGFAGATLRLAEFMQEAERTGALREFIQEGIDSIKSLIETGRQVTRILGNLGDIGRIVFAGLGVGSGGLLDTIEKLTVQLKAFLGTAKGKSALATVLQLASHFAQSFFGFLQQIGTMLAPIMPQIIGLLTAFNNLKTAILEALEPAVTFIGEQVLPALTSILEWLAANGPVLQGILIALFTAWAIHAGFAAAATLAATWPLVLVGVAVAALAALIITHWDTIKAVTQAVWNFVLGVIQGVWNWVSENWPLLLAILTGPIGWAVLLIVQHWETIKAAAAAVIDWVKANWPLLLGILTGPIGWAVLLLVAHWQTIKDAFTGVKDWIVDRVDDIVDAIAGIPGRIAGIGGQIKDKITGGLSGIGGAVKGAIGGLNPFAHGGITGAATGGPRSGLTMVGEHGRELVDLPAGSRVHGNAMTEAALARGGGGGGRGPLVVDVRGSSAELIALLQSWIQANTGGDVQAALGYGAP